MTDGTSAETGRPVFLWGAPPPLPDVRGFAPRSSRWWAQYTSSLSTSPASLAELSRTSQEIAALLPDPQRWGEKPSPYCGLVVGAVQSGKTASMMGVASIALDQGYRIIVVLAGAKDDLRQQTARRFNAQLLKQSDEVAPTGATTLGTPKGPGPLGGFAAPFQLDVNQFSLFQLKLLRALNANEPVVVVVKKNIVSLRELQNSLEVAFARLGAHTLPMLVLDDECDEASVDEADATIPAAIYGLWRRSGRSPANVAYVGYTATAAANVLQSRSNALYPEEFAYLLKYPGPEASSLTYKESDPDAWYSGGECFYAAFGDEPSEDSNFLVSACVEGTHLAGTVENNESLALALRLYFVGCAYRLALSPERTFDDPRSWPLAQSMLVQTSADTDEHSRWASGIVEMLHGRPCEGRAFSFDIERLGDMVETHEQQWRECFDRLDLSRERVYSARPRSGVQKRISWNDVKLLLREVFSRTRLKVINSDPALGAALDFAAQRMPDGTLLPPQDTFVIVVGGSKLSRGLTVEGLCISYFVRWPDHPTEDTVLQMSRWFGYRGTYLEFCRIFTTPRIADELARMHENDRELRLQLAQLMRSGRSPRDARLVLQANPRALPTGKMGGGVVVDLTLSPFVHVFRKAEIGDSARYNQESANNIVGRIRARGGIRVFSRSGIQKGFLSRGWTCREAADCLDSFRFEDHNPNDEENLLRGFYRKSLRESRVVSGRDPLNDPFQVAAYLRAWEDDAAQKRCGASPLFSVGFVCGEMSAATEPFDFPLVNREITADGIVVGGWSGKSDSWDGDVFFDGLPLTDRVFGTSHRIAGSSGLLLLYVVHRSATGRSGRGVVRAYHTPVFGISVPSGGPQFRRVVSKVES